MQPDPLRLSLTPWETAQAPYGLAIYQAVRGKPGGSADAEARLHTLVRKLGGDPDLDDYGAGALADNHIGAA